jgi:hypothetical protein
MKQVLSILFTIFTMFGYTQVGINTLMEKNVTKNIKTTETQNFNEEYQTYLKKSHKQAQISTGVLVAGTVINSLILFYYDRTEINKRDLYIINNTLTVGISTTFLIQSNKNRKKAYELKRRTYL